MTLRCRPAAVLLAAATVALSGCKESVDLAAVNDLAKSAAASHSAFDAVAVDYQESCVRRTVYQLIGSSMEQYFPRTQAPRARVQLQPPTTQVTAPALSVNDLATLPSGELARRLTPAVARSLSPAQLIALAARRDSAQIFQMLSPETLDALDRPSMARSDAAASCTDEQSASRAWQQSNAVLVNYFIALGKMAGGGSGDDTYGLKALARDVSASNIVGAPRATAIGNFATTVLDQIYDAKRRGTLARYIPEADKSLGNAIAVVESFATDDYAHALSRERVVADRFFRRNLQLAQPGEPAFAVLGFADAWSDRMKLLDRRKAAIRSYVNSWETLRASHANVLAAITRNDTRGAIAVAQAVYSSISPDLSALRRAFSEDK